MRNKAKLKAALNSKEYKVVLYDAVCGCPICSLRKGCNRDRYGEDNWKSYRMYQWKEKE